MKPIFILKEISESEFLDPKSNIERLRRIRCINLKPTGKKECRESGKILPLNDRKVFFKIGRKIA